MTPEERKAAAEVMASDGPWQWRQRDNDKWCNANNTPCFDWCKYEYRVKPNPIVRYVNFYSGPVLQMFHVSRKEADLNAERGRIACVRIQFLPGQFDE